MKRKSPPSLMLGLCTLAAVSCTEIDLNNLSKDIYLQQSLVAPLGETTIKVQDFIDGMNLQENIERDADTINFISETKKNYSFQNLNLSQPTVSSLSLPLSASAVAAQSTIYNSSGSQNISLGLDPTSNSKRIDSISFSTLQYKVNVKVTDIKDENNNAISPSDINITLSFPNFKSQTGNYPLNQVINYSAFNTDATQTLSNVFFNSAGKTGIPVNVQIKSGSKKLIIGNSGNIEIKINFSTFAYSVAWGKFEPVALSENIVNTPLDMIKDGTTGVRFANPKVYMTIQSNIGSFLNYNINYVKAFSKDGSVTKSALFGTSTTTTELIDAIPTTPGTFIQKSMKPLNKDYGHTDLLFDTDKKLDTLSYKFSVSSTQIAGKTTTQFVVPDMNMKMDLKVSIPLYIKAGSSINYTDTLNNVDIASDKIQNCILIAKLTNSFPVKFNFKMKFADAQGHLIPCSFNDNTYTINSAEVDNYGLVTKTNNTEIKLELSKSDLDKLANASKLIYSITLAGQTNQSAIQITAKDYLLLKLGFYAKAGFETTIGSDN
jgi:hypothetical protein